MKPERRPFLFAVVNAVLAVVAVAVVGIVVVVSQRVWLGM